jgi:hypothetical protein
MTLGLRSANALAIAITLLLSAAHTAYAANEVTPADLQAAVRAIGFLDPLPRDQTITVGIVYASSLTGGRALAVQAAEQLKAIPGPNRTPFQAEIIATDGLAQFVGRADAVFLMPGTSKDQAAIVEFLRRRHLVSISNDPACMDAKCCVLMVRTVGGVEIVLDTQLAEAVGAHFSSVFTMMVKRK